jgi:membrane protease YdiL (CAAX protease family)
MGMFLRNGLSSKDVETYRLETRRPGNLLCRHSLVIGITLMFLLTWPIDLANAGVLPVQVPFAVSILLGWGFILASLIMTGSTLGKGAVIALLKRFLLWRVGWQWYLVAFLFYPAFYGFAVLLNAAFTQTPIDFSTVMASRIFGTPASLPVFILPFFVFDALTNGEEMGWRGYVLPRLQAKHSALVSSLILGAVWGLWHLPKYLAPGDRGHFALGTVKVLVDAIEYHGDRSDRHRRSGTIGKNRIQAGSRVLA